MVHINDILNNIVPLKYEDIWDYLLHKISSLQNIIKM